MIKEMAQKIFVSMETGNEENVNLSVLNVEEWVSTKQSTMSPNVMS